VPFQFPQRDVEQGHFHAACDINADRVRDTAFSVANRLQSADHNRRERQA
jgi:hypothetical protein